MPRGLTVTSAQRLTRRLAARALPKRSAVSLAVVESNTARALNHRYRGRNRVPDVLSFTLDESNVTGDIVLAREALEHQARSFGWPVEFEFARLTLHGFLHLAGMRHAKSVDALRMERRERRILAAVFPKLRNHPNVKQFLSPRQ